MNRINVGKLLIEVKSSCLSTSEMGFLLLRFSLESSSKSFFCDELILPQMRYKGGPCNANVE